MILPTCKSVSAAAARGELSAFGFLHLAYCRHCRRFRRQLALVTTALREAVFERPTPERLAALERRILSRLLG